MSYKFVNIQTCLIFKVKKAPIIMEEMRMYRGVLFCRAFKDSDSNWLTQFSFSLIVVSLYSVVLHITKRIFTESVYIGSISSAVLIGG